MIPTNHLRRRRARAGVTALALSGLLALAACGSDEESTDDIVAPATVTDGTSSTEDTASTGNSTTDSSTIDTSTIDTGSEGTVSISVPVPDFDASGLTDQQREIAEMVLQFASSAGMEVDTDCVVDAIGQLSEDDAQKIIDAGVEGDPDLSAAGDAIGDELGACAELPEISLPDISIPEISAP